MTSEPDIDPQSRQRRDLLVRSFLEIALGLVGIFILAAVIAPDLFNVRNDLAVLLAVLVWIACPVLALLLAWRTAARWRRGNGGLRP